MDKRRAFSIFLTGMAIGAAAGFLFAPYRGEKTRRKLANRIRKFSRNISGKMEHAAEGIQDGYENIKSKLSRVHQAG
jgi:gas vesicle protein